MRHRVAILTSDDAHHKYLAAVLSQRLNIVATVTEPSSSPRVRLWATGRKTDYAFAIYHVWRRQLLGLDAFRRRYFKRRISPDLAMCGRVTVPNINCDEVRSFLRTVLPTIVIVMGTSILDTNTLKAAGPTVINIHGGCLPYYRGNHCFFFALLHRRLDRLASTIHFVDSGIDTGDIIEHVVPPARPWESAEVLYCRAERRAIHRLVELLKQLEQGHPLPRSPQASRHRLYRTRDRLPHHDVLLYARLLKNWLLRKKRRRGRSRAKWFF